MKNSSIRKMMISTGSLWSLTLIGILVLSALLYYRAVKIQRFLEPALAITEPRIKFNQEINDLLIKELGPTAKGIKFRSGSIYVPQSMLFAILHHKEGSGPFMIDRLSHIFLSALSNPDIRSYISLILISINLPLTENPDLNKELRLEGRRMAALILNDLFAAAPLLEKQFGKYFAVTSLPADAPAREPGWIEFRMIPTERLHIEVLQRLEKYSY